MAREIVTLGIVELVNRDRIAAGCLPVGTDPELQRQSRVQATRQAAEDRMFHSNGVTGFNTWGENVAAGYDSAVAVHAAWMDSPGHRANILDCDFVWMGIAASEGASGTIYWTEQFGG